jgi:hypothetical protein
LIRARRTSRWSVGGGVGSDCGQLHELLQPEAESRGDRLLGDRIVDRLARLGAGRFRMESVFQTARREAA